MAETAKILNPDKTVIIPDMNAGCSLADSAPIDRFMPWVESHPGHVVISYINCSAAVKAASDIICTSSNAEKIVASIPSDQKICFAPDKYLGSFISKKTGRDMVLWDGSCQVHEIFSELEIINLMKQNPDALLLAHPECRENVLQYADYVGSTNGIIDYAVKSNAREFIIATEPGIIHQLEMLAPEKRYIPVPNINGCSCNECPHMRLNTIEKMVSALETLQPQIILPEDVRLRALRPLERMLELS
jgi:quinolinate synthase